MSNSTNINPVCDSASLTSLDSTGCSRVTLNVYTATRIVYEVIKTYMLANTPEQAGVRLNHTYDADYKKSGILLDIGYNWRTKDMSKVPAVFIQRGDATFKTPTMGQHDSIDIKRNRNTRFALCTLPVSVTCVAAEPLAVVEQLAEYIKQPLLYFRNEVQLDFGIRRFQLKEITQPKLLAEGKNNFFVNLNLEVTFDDNWVVERDSLKIKHIGVELFDQLSNPLQTLEV